MILSTDIDLNYLVLHLVHVNNFWKQKLCNKVTYKTGFSKCLFHFSLAKYSYLSELKLIRKSMEICPSLLLINTKMQSRILFGNCIHMKMLLNNQLFKAWNVTLTLFIILLESLNFKLLHLIIFILVTQWTLLSPYSSLNNANQSSCWYRTGFFNLD